MGGADGAAAGGSMGRGGGGPFPIRLARGARAVEARLAVEVAELVSASEREPQLLRYPVRVVVPSSSLRLHLSASLMHHFGRGVAGVNVQTLYALALEIVERAGGEGAASDAQGGGGGRGSGQGRDRCAARRQAGDGATTRRTRAPRRRAREGPG